MNWQTIIEKNKKALENLLLLASHGYYAGENYGFVINSSRFLAESTTEMMNSILTIVERRLKPYKNSSKVYNKVTVSISASGSGVYIEYSAGETKI